MWIDAHAHLSGLDNTQLDQAVAAASAAGVHTILNTGTDLDSSATVIAQSRRHSALAAAAGISPFDAELVPPDWRARLADLLASPAVVALGEIGLDSSNPRYPSLAAQRPLFEQQLELAAQSGLTAVVHSRGTESLVVDICKEAGLSRVVFHCFTGTRGNLEKLLDAGFVVSFSGIVTFPSSQLPALVPLVPLGQLLVETDSPYLSPVPLRGSRNEPSRVALVGAAVAAMRSEEPDALAAAVCATFARLFQPQRRGPAVSIFVS